MSNLLNIKNQIDPTAYYSKELEGQLSKHTGRNWYLWGGLCPFHADRRAGSFYINTKTGAFKCFSCDASGGDLIDFQQMRHNQTFIEAISTLKEAW